MLSRQRERVYQIICTNCLYHKTLSSRSQYVCNSIKTFDFSTLCTAIPNTLLKSNIKELTQRCAPTKNGGQRYQYLVIGRDNSYLVKSHSKSNNKYKQDKNIHMLHILIDSMFVLFGGWVFQLTIGMGTNYAPQLADLFLHAYKAK